MTILRITPESVEGGMFALGVEYGYIVDGHTFDVVREDVPCEDPIEIEGPRGIVLWCHVIKDSKADAVAFLKDRIVTGKFFITLKDDMPLHCDDCGQIVVHWLAGMQYEWAEKYHAEWWTSYSSGNGSGSQRLH